MGFTTNDSLRKYTTLLQRHTDVNGNNICEEIKDEVKQVIDREIILEQIPHPYMGISVIYSEKNPATNNVTNTILKEIDMSETLASSDQIKIDYDTGKIIFHYTLEGKYINTTYWGMGYNLINSSRVYTKLDENGNVIQTLEDIIEILRNMNNAGYIVDTLQNLETEIGKLKVPVIDDVNVKTDKTYSSSKIENRITNHRHDASQIDNLPQPSEGSDDAKDIKYDNTTSKLVSTKVQGAIDEIVVKTNDLLTKINANTSNIDINKTETDKLIADTKVIAEDAKQLGDKVKKDLVDKLISEGLDVSTTDSFTNLISKIELEKHKNMPAWYNISDVWVSDKTENVSDDDTVANKDQTTVGNKIYVFGVRGSKAYFNGDITKCYDAITNTWSTKASMPTDRNNLNTIANGNLIYVIGGSVKTGSNSTDQHVIDMVECYDTITNTWSTKAPLTTARYCVSLNVYKDKIYVIGGSIKYNNSSESVISNNDCYDTITNTWSTKAPLNTGRSHIFSSVFNGKIYCAGGLIYNNSTNITECYDIESDTWSTKTIMPRSKHGNNGVLIKDNMYCFAGSISSGTTINVEEGLQVYNITNNSWSTKTKCPYSGIYPITSVGETCYSLTTSKSHMYLA